MSIIDYIAIFLIIYFVIVGYRHGFVYELLSLAGLIAALYIAANYYYRVAPSILPFIRNHLNSDTHTALVLANIASYFALVTAVILVFIFILIPLLKKAFRVALSTGFDKLMGIMFGFFKGVAVVIILFNIVYLFTPNFNSYFLKKYGNIIFIRKSTNLQIPKLPRKNFPVPKAHSLKEII